jgi:hypothetical protein
MKEQKSGRYSHCFKIYNGIAFSMEQKTYKIRIDATINSTLRENELKEKLAISLYDIEKMQSIADSESEELEVVEYDFVEAFELDESVK